MNRLRCYLEGVDFRILVLISSALGTAASLFFIEVVLDKWELLNLAGKLAIAFVIWAPCNYFTSLAFRQGKTETVIFLFGLFSTYLDGLVGLVIQRYTVTNWAFLIAGTIGTTIVIAATGSTPEVKVDKRPSRNERQLYGLAVLLFVAMLSFHVWDEETQTTWSWAVYSTISSVLEYAGAVMLIRWTFKKVLTPEKEAFVASICYVPLTWAVIYLFEVMPNLTFTGALQIVENGLMPFIIAAALMKRNVKPVEWAIIALGIASILGVYFAF